MERLRPWDVERICPICGETYKPSKFNHTTQIFCSDGCRDYYRNKRRYIQRKEEDLCIECGGEKHTVKVRCEDCAKRDAQRCRAWREEQREEGNCVRCGTPLPHGTIAEGNDVCPGCVNEARIYEETGDYTHGRQRRGPSRPNPIEETMDGDE